MIHQQLAILVFGVFLSGCGWFASGTETPDSHTTLRICNPHGGFVTLSRHEYAQKLYGFWLGKSIANWTGLVTEMDKVGAIGPLKTGPFYTRNDWGKADQPSIWGQGIPSNLSDTIDFVFADENEMWGADDDTDIEYMYQYLLAEHRTTVLTAEQIRNGWLHHIYSQKDESPFGLDPEGLAENYLWVSNQQAYNLMEERGMLPPETGSPEFNPHYDMIDAQLTTEIFGLFAPGRPDIARKLAHLPIRTTASEEAAAIAEFYVVIYSLAALADSERSVKDNLMWMAEAARAGLVEDEYPAKMYDFVKGQYLQGTPWETTRDMLYQRYQVDQMDGYTVSSRNLYCNGCFAAGINFAASLVSLFYGEGDLPETIKIGSLAGWDSDNPTATWGGLLGFMLGKEGVEHAFNRTFSNRFNIHRTRRNFPNNGVDTFDNMADVGVTITARVLLEEGSDCFERSSRLK